MICPWNDFKECFGSECPYYGVVANYTTTTTTDSSHTIKYGCRRVDLMPVQTPIKEQFYSGDIPAACMGCPNHPANGGSGICHCILGSNVVY